MYQLLHHRKALLIVLLLCVTGVAQFAALVGEPESHHSADHCCLLCHMGPLHFLQASPSAGLAPVFAVIWLTPAADEASAHDVQLPSSLARAPPAA
jgi:hypothetical protein